MIQITCTNCKTVLSIDDAFAGGVCRCRHCGTIQTVPKHLLNTSNGEASALGQAGGKVLFQNKKSAVADGPGAGTGLDDLANVVASSGLSSGRLRGDKQPDSAPRTTAPASDKKTVLIIAAGAIILVLLGVIVFMAVRDKSSTSISTTRPADKPVQDPNKLVWNAGENVKVTKAPQFLGQRIIESSVVYIIDRGQGAQAEGKFDPLKDAVIRSLETLGSGRKFQVVFWSLDNKVWAFPDNGLTNAEPKKIDECRKKMEDVYASGQTKVGPALEKALKSNPDIIMLVPVKSLLENEFHTMVMKTRGSNKVKINTFSIGHSDTGEPLRKIARETGGTYFDLQMSDLRNPIR